MKKIFWYSIAVLLVLTAFLFFYFSRSYKNTFLSPMGKLYERPLDAYTIDMLGVRKPVSSQIVLGDPKDIKEGYKVYTFYFTTDGKKVSGLAHIPDHKQGEKLPVIVQLRGYVDREKYTIGEGARKSGEVFAANGFITLAPDFLGYGDSDMPSGDIFKERFETYTTVLDLLASVGTLPMADSSRIGIWGHSNGGHIALIILEVTQSSFPTSLWAPVTKPFPYSIIYYTDELSDRGKFLRRSLAEFEKEYDVELYSLTNYIDRIQAPIEIQQGTKDESVPESWSTDFVAELKKLGKSVEYYIYLNTDHNMVGNWYNAVSRDIQFYQKHLRKI